MKSFACPRGGSDLQRDDADFRDGWYVSVNAAFVRTPEEAAIDVSLMTRAGVTRIVRFSFKLVESRPRRLLTVVTKSNAQRHAMVIWGEIAAEIAMGFADFGQDAGRRHYHAHELKPQTLDTIAVTNCTRTSCPISRRRSLGSLGIAPTANLTLRPST